MDRFLQLHLLTSYPPANLNRDDLGRPKTAVVGGQPRLRISSQSLKRAWRTSDAFQEALAGHVGVRTKRMGKEVFDKLRAAGVGPADALAWAWTVAQQFGKPKTKNEADVKKAAKELDTAKLDDLLQIEQLAHFGPAELAAIHDLVAAVASRGKAPNDDELELLRQKPGAVDIALFGRMVAADPVFNQEAAAQVAHAISVNAVQVEDDFFTAVDDLKPKEEDVGAGHMGEVEFGAGVFYLYVCVDRGLLVENLGGDEGLARRAVRALTEAAATVAPTGKQATFASRARASFILAETGDQQPRSLAVAFLDPVVQGPMLETAIKRLNDTASKMDQVYGPCAASSQRLDADKGEGTLAALLDFVGE
jgi:CRISPR system Cascade subunit CasC